MDFDGISGDAITTKLYIELTEEDIASKGSLIMASHNGSKQR